MSDIKETLTQLVHVGEELKCENIRAYELENPAVADFVLLLSAKNPVHCKAVQEAILEAHSKTKGDALSTDIYGKPRLSGGSDSEWIVMDFNAVIVHVMTDQMRVYYEIDGLFEGKGTVFHY